MTRSFHLRWVMASLAGLAVTSAYAQDLDAGKTGAQLFAQDCAACHRSPRGLSKSMSSGSLVSFLRQHYTSGSASAGTVAAYVLGSGGGDPRAGQKGDQAKGSKQARPTDPNAPPGAQPTARQRDQVARPGDATADPQGRPGKKSRRHPEAAPAASAPASPEPAEAATAAVPTDTPRPPAGVPAAPEPRAPTAATPAAAAPGFGEPIP